MLPGTLQFIIAMIACSINERLQHRLDYAQEKVRVLPTQSPPTRRVARVHTHSPGSGARDG